MAFITNYFRFNNSFLYIFYFTLKRHKLKTYSTIFVISILFAVTLIVKTEIRSILFENVLAQGEGGAGQQGANQTMQQQDPQHAANRTMEKAIQSANETGEDVAKVGSQVTEGAKDLIGNIGKKLQDLGK